MDYVSGRTTSILLTVGLLIIVAVVQSYWKAWQRRRQLDAFAEEKGCGTPLTLQGEWPLGIDLLVKGFQADGRGQILDFFSGIIFRTGTTFQQILLANRSIGTIDPDNIEAMLSTQFTEFSLGVRVRNFEALLGHGIFTQDGAAWKASRDLLRPQFMHTRSDNFDDVQQEVEKLVQTISTQVTASEKATIDLQPLFFRFTLTTTMAVLYGRSYTVNLDVEEESVFADAFNEAQHWLARRGRLGDFYWLLGGESFRKSCKTVHDYVDKIVHAALADDLARGDKASAEDAEQQRYVFLQALIARTKDPKVIRDQMLNILLAGRDTTACLLSWTFRLLAQHPDIQTRLREECTSLPSHQAGSLPTKAELKKMQYLERVLREVLRLYPSVPVNMRTALQTTTLPRGGSPDGTSPIVVEKGEDVAFSIYTMHRSQKIYGPDAHQFRPERWVVGGNQTLTDRGDVGWGYLPFNGGPRVCLGREFALLEASYATVRILQTFDKIELDEDGAGREEKQSLTLVVSCADGCKVRLTPRSPSTS